MEGTVRRVATALVVAAAIVSAPALLAQAKKAPAPSQRTAIKVDGAIIKGYIQEIAGNDDLGRRSLTPGYEKVAEWAAGKFKEWGLVPAGDNGTYLQSVPLTGARTSFYWTTGTPELSVNGRPFLVRDNDFTIDNTSTPAADVTAEVVFVGYGISAPAKGIDEYAGVDVKGRIVLALKGSPMDAPVARGMMGGGGPPPKPAGPVEEWKAESTDEAKAKTAYEKGAAAILLYSPPATAQFPGMAVTPAAPAMPAGMGAPREIAPSPFTRPFVVVSNIDQRVFRAILLTDPQEGTAGFDARIGQTRRDIRELKPRSMATGAKVRVKGYDTVVPHGEKFKNNVTRNVLAKIEGVDPKLKDQYVVLGGHLDHLGVRDGVVYNGADDNASGSAVTMEVARLLAVNKVKPKRTIVFGLWAAEEMGLLGSNYFVKSPSAGISIDRVVTYFNMDMVGLGTEIGAPGALNFPSIYDVIMRDQDPEIAKAVRASTGGPGGSDHSAFIELGIEALALMTAAGGGHPDYHQPGDDPEKIDPVILGKTGQFVLQGVLNLANEVKTPLLITDRQVQYHALRFSPPDFSPKARGGWTSVAATTPAELMALLNKRAAELKQQARGQAPAAAAGPVVIRMGGAAGAGRLGTGIGDTGVFGGNTALVETAVTLLDIGRVDVVKDDGVWFSNGLTERGREALKAFETNNVIVNLVNPSAKLLGDVLDAAAKPFVVTKAQSIEPALAEKMKSKPALLVVSCETADVAGCQTALQNAKAAFAGADNIVLTIAGGTDPLEEMMRAVSGGGDVSEEARKKAEEARKKAEESRKALYLSLLKAGWTRDEIVAMSGAAQMGMGGPAAGARANLSKLFPAPAMPPR